MVSARYDGALDLSPSRGILAEVTYLALVPSAGDHFSRGAHMGRPQTRAKLDCAYGGRELQWITGGAREV